MKDWYLKNRDEMRLKNHEYYLKNKERLIAKKKEWLKTHKDKHEQYRKTYNTKSRALWRANANPQASKVAEEMIVRDVLPKLGFTEQFKPIANFYFDSLAKKNGQICAIEITTRWGRTMDKLHIQVLDYFKLPLYLFFVRPDLTGFSLVERQPLSKRTSFSPNQAKKFIFEKGNLVAC